MDNSFHCVLNLGNEIATTFCTWHGSPLSWWRHRMETFSALLTLCEGNPSDTGGFPSQRPVMRSFDVFLDLLLNQRLSKPSRRRWFETPSHSLQWWRTVQNVITAAEAPVKFQSDTSILTPSLAGSRLSDILRKSLCDVEWARCFINNDEAVAVREIGAWTHRNGGIKTIREKGVAVDLEPRDWVLISLWNRQVY